MMMMIVRIRVAMTKVAHRQSKQLLFMDSERDARWLVE